MAAPIIRKVHKALIMAISFPLNSSPSIAGFVMDILSDSCVMTIGVNSSLQTYTQMCKDGYPSGNVNVILRTVSVLAKNVGQVTWSPDGTIGPVTALRVPTTPNVKMTLERIVPLNSGTIFYISMNMENSDPSLISIMPANVYLIDLLGRKNGTVR